MLLAAGVWERFCQTPAYHAALAGGLGIALLCGLLSALVVLKRMAFIGQGISHAAFGGVGVAMLLGLLAPPARGLLVRDAIIAVFCVATAVAIGAVARRGRLSEDTAIGICLVAAMALGVLLIDLRSWWLSRLIASGAVRRRDVGYTPGIHSLLFGDILMVRAVDAAVAWALAAAVAALMAATFKELVFFAFDEEAAAVFGVRVRLLYYGLLVFLGVAVVAAMRSLGVILASALLVLPGAAARFWCRTIGRLVAFSAAAAVAAMAGGFFLAIWLARASFGPVIVLTLFAVFVLSWALSGLRRRRVRERGRDPRGQA
jgi:zinc transport system permease protein